MNASTSTARRNSHTVLLCAVFTVLTWAILSVLFLLRGIGESVLPIDYIVNATNTSVIFA